MKLHAVKNLRVFDIQGRETRDEIYLNDIAIASGGKYQMSESVKNNFFISYFV